MYHAKKVSFYLSLLNSDDTKVRETARSSLKLHMEKRKVPATTIEDNNFLGFKLNAKKRLDKQSKVNWPHSSFLEFHELCLRLGVQVGYQEEDDLYAAMIPAAVDDDEIMLRYINPSRLFTALKQREILHDLEHWHSLQQQGALSREAYPVADMACSNSHLTNSNITDHLTRFIAKGRLQLLETNAVNNTYYPNTYSRSCPLCQFHTDTNSHALNGCSKLKGLYIERHDRCVQVLRRELEENVLTEFCEIYENQTVSLDGLSVAGPCKPDLCIIDHLNSVAFIIEIANPFDTFIDKCYEHKFHKYMPLCLTLNEAGFFTKIIVLIIGSLGTVHRRFGKGLMLLGLSKRKSKSLTKYLSLSVMIGSRRIWARRNHMMQREG